MKEIVEALGQVSALWLDPQNTFRQETSQALQVSTGLNQRQIELALTNCFEELTLPKITAYITSFGQAKRSNRMKVVHVLPANVFTAWVHGAVTTLLLGHQCLLKPSSREPVFARAWRESVAKVDPELASNITIVPWSVESLAACEAVVAYGSDETLVKIRAEVPASIPLVGYGHRLSVGIIFEEALKEGFSEQLLDAVCQAADPFRLQGCLSPQILYVESTTEIRWPALEGALDVVPKIKPFGDWEALRKELAKFSPYLSCVGYAGNLDRQSYLENELWDLKVSRICLLNEMQRPPLTWRNGGIFLPDLLHFSRD